MDNFLRQTAAGRVAGFTDSPEPQLPPSVSGYTTGRLLGAGSSARVWLVEEQRTGALRALKVSAPPKGTPGSDADPGPGQISQLHREVTVLGSVKHPHLLGLHGVVPSDQGPAILMDYAGGGSLLNLVTARGRLSVGECITILAPMAQALAYLHSSSIQHGDVSPGNILFTAEGKPLLADLGVGRLLGEGGGPAAGTAGFTAGDGSPQAGRGAGLSAGYAADVYSLAAIGWYVLTGSPPGPARERVPLTLLVPEVPGELLHILEAGLRDDPDERPAANELAETVLRSAAPQSLDLVAAVHPSVLPELLTRRTTDNRVPVPPRRFPAALERFGLRRPTFRPCTQRKAKRRATGRRRGTGRRGRWRAAVPGSVAALFVLCGVLLAGPNLPGTARPMPDGVQQHAAADAVAPAYPSITLTPELEERLANTDPVKALSALVAVRAQALTTADAGLLAHVNVEDSEAMTADQDLVAGLRERGHVFNGLSIRVQQAALTDSIAVPEGAAAVAATAVMSGYTETDSTGAAVRRVTGAVPQDLVFVLVKQDGIWKIESVHNSDTL